MNPRIVFVLFVAVPPLAGSACGRMTDTDDADDSGAAGGVSGDSSSDSGGSGGTGPDGGGVSGGGFGGNGGSSGSAAAGGTAGAPAAPFQVTLTACSEFETVKNVLDCSCFPAECTKAWSDFRDDPECADAAQCVQGASITCGTLNICGSHTCYAQAACASCTSATCREKLLAYYACRVGGCAQRCGCEPKGGKCTDQYSCCGLPCIDGACVHAPIDQCLAEGEPCSVEPEDTECCSLRCNDGKCAAVTRCDE